MLRDSIRDTPTVDGESSITLQGFYIHPRWLLFGISEASTVSYKWKHCHTHTHPIAGFDTSQVVQDLFHQQYHTMLKSELLFEFSFFCYAKPKPKNNPSQRPFLWNLEVPRLKGGGWWYFRKELKWLPGDIRGEIWSGPSMVNFPNFK